MDDATHSRSSRSSRRIDSDWIPLDASRMSDGASSRSSLSPSDHGCCPSTKSMSLSGSSVTETPRRHRLSRLSSFRLPTPLYMAARSAGSGWTTGGAPSSRLVSSLMFWLPSPGPPLPLTAQDPRFLPTEHVWSLCEPHNRPQTCTNTRGSVSSSSRVQVSADGGCCILLFIVLHTAIQPYRTHRMIHSPDTCRRCDVTRYRLGRSQPATVR
eukprot:1330621-Rhodomonas_salina.2